MSKRKKRVRKIKPPTKAEPFAAGRKCGCPSIIDFIPGHCHDCGSFWEFGDHCPKGCR